MKTEKQIRKRLDDECEFVRENQNKMTGEHKIQMAGIINLLRWVLSDTKKERKNE